MTSREAFEEFMASSPEFVGGVWVRDARLVWQAAVEACKPWMRHTGQCDFLMHRHDPEPCSCGLEDFLRSET